VLSITCFTISCNYSTKDETTEDSKIKPNIIFILADDFGIVDSQAYAARFTKADTSNMYYETPHLDRLISQGTAFSQAYANPLCSPSRASILTGINASRLGFMTAMPPRSTYYNQNLPVPENYYIHDVLEHKDDIKIEQAWINATSNSALPTGQDLDQGKDVWTIAEALEEYHSAFLGKWHIGGFGAEGYQPKNNGFEELAYYDAGGSPYFNWREDWNNTSKTLFPEMPQEKWEVGSSGSFTGKNYLTDDLTEQALAFIERQSQTQEQPFFLYFSHFAIHSPYQALKEDIAYFEKKKTKGWNNHKDPVYAAMIKSMDRSIGAIMNKLKETGLEDNTLIVFMSDNGGIDSKLTPRGKGSDNSPFVGGKATLNEGGIRVPLVLRWKGKLKEAHWVDEPVFMTDIFPSLLTVAGFDSEEISQMTDLDGQSILHLASDQPKQNRSYKAKPFYWHYPFNVIYKSPYDGLPLTPHSAIRDGDYKLIFDWYGRLYLYNIEKDPFEEHNLSASNPQLTQQLFAQLKTWLTENVEERYIPKLNPDYNPSKEAREEPFKSLF
jgi:arylsulfatase A-like enzyme